LLPFSWSKHFTLMNDLDLSSVSPNGLNRIAPYSWCTFTGTFDGNSHCLANYAYDLNLDDNVGIFGFINHEDAYIKNLKLETFQVQSSNKTNIGTLAGQLVNGQIFNCSVENSFVSGKINVGGLCGNSGSSSEISDILIKDSDISGSEYVGGLCGYHNSSLLNSQIIDCQITGDIYIGGIVGENNGEIFYCSAKAVVQGEESVGGIAGLARGFIEYSTSNSTIIGDVNVGGIAGYSFAKISYCYSLGDIYGIDSVAGLIGCISSYAKLSYCYTATNISGIFRTAGLYARTSISNITVSNTYFNRDLCEGNIIFYAGTEKTTDELQNINTFLDRSWDFVGESENGIDDIWQMCINGMDYPRLSWEFIPGDFVYPGEVNLWDLVVFSSYWMANDPFCCDIAPYPEGDRIVNFLDYAEFAKRWFIKN